MREIKETDLVGKTVMAVGIGNLNVLKLIFTDGTSLELLAENAFLPNYGSVPGIFVKERE
jgi:hypothetical protein